MKDKKTKMFSRCLPAERGRGWKSGIVLKGNLVVVLVADNHLAEADFLGAF